jgi:hypothetical protein
MHQTNQHHLNRLIQQHHPCSKPITDLPSWDGNLKCNQSSALVSTHPASHEPVPPLHPGSYHAGQPITPIEEPPGLGTRGAMHACAGRSIFKHALPSLFLVVGGRGDRSALLLSILYVLCCGGVVKPDGE